MASSAVVRSGKVVPKLVAWVSSKDPEVKANALDCCALLSMHDTGCAEEIGTPEFLTQVGNMYKAKDKNPRRGCRAFLQQGWREQDGATADTGRRRAQAAVDDGQE